MPLIGTHGAVASRAFGQFTLPPVPPTLVVVQSGNIALRSSSGCNSPGQTTSTRTMSFSDSGTAFFLNGGQFTLEASMVLDASGQVASGSPTLALSALGRVRLRNTSNSAIFLESTGNLVVASALQSRTTGSHLAQITFVVTPAAQATLPTGNYILQTSTESVFSLGNANGGFFSACGAPIKTGSTFAVRRLQ